VRRFHCLGFSVAYERENDTNTKINRFNQNRITRSIDETSKAHLNRNDVEWKAHLYFYVDTGTG
jgi:hypothetical protein